MNSKDILKADLLDILFENRNKDYGAYALRREYQGRLMLATSFIFLLLLFMILVAGFGNESPAQEKTVFSDSVKITEVDDSQLLPNIPPPVQQVQQPDIPREERLFSDVIDIRPDNTALNRVPTAEELATAITSDRNRTGRPDDLRPLVQARPNLPITRKTDNTPGQVFEPDEKDAEFPGGKEALRDYVASHLVTPGEIQPGETRTVHIRFIIGTDGSVSEFEIVKSGGYTFDQEVIRVCKKMPRWKPARQNGIYVPVTFMLPISFVGIEG